MVVASWPGDPAAELRRVQVAAQAKPVGLLDVEDVGDRQARLGVHPGHAAEAGGADRAAVIAVAARDDDLLVRLAEQAPVVADEADDGVVGLGPGIGEEHPVEAGRRQLAQLAGQLDGRRVGALEEAVVVGQLPQLAAPGVGQLGAAVAEVDAPEPGHPVEDLLAVLLPDVHALGPRDDPCAALAELAVIRERVQEVLPVLLLPPGEILSHGHCPSGTTGSVTGLRHSIAGIPAPREI